MSVLRSKREFSKSEFEHSFFELYQYSMLQTSKVPKRRTKWLCYEINSTMNTIYRNLMNVTDFYFKDKRNRYEYRTDTALLCIDLLNSLEKPLMILWNIQKSDMKTMTQWIVRIRHEIDMLNQMHDKEDIECEVSVLDWRAINNAKFLKTMSELHRYTHGKVSSAYMAYDNTQGALLISLVNDAFYELIVANSKLPKTKLEYEKRRQHISNAIAYLQEMNRPLLFYFNLMKYSERVMVEWSDLLTSEIKMITAVQKSDKERFAHLP